MTWIDDRIQQYYAWMKDNTIVHEDNGTGWCSVSTPFIGIFNDHIQVFIKKEGEKILLSDDGQTLDSLSLTGVDINRSARRKELVEMILRTYGVQLQGKELIASASEKTFPRMKHAFISAICEISDLEIMAKHTVASVFKEDVDNFLKEQDVIFTPQFTIKGSTGLDFNFDFHIAGKKSELVIKPFNLLTQSGVELFLFSWDDIKQTREFVTKKEINSLAIINDINSEPKKDLIEALYSKNAKVMLWSQRFTPDNIRSIKEVA